VNVNTIRGKLGPENKDAPEKIAKPIPFADKTGGEKKSEWASGRAVVMGDCRIPQAFRDEKVWHAS